MEKSFPRQYKSNKNDKTRKMYIELCEFCFGDVSKRNNKKKRVLVDDCYQPVSDMSKYIIISLEQNIYNHGFVYVVNQFFKNDIEFTHSDKCLIQLKVTQDFFSRFATNNYYYEYLLKDIEESNEYKHLRHLSQFANFNHFLTLFYDFFDLFKKMQNDLIVKEDKLNKNIINLFEDFKNMSAMNIFIEIAKLFNDGRKDEIPTIKLKPKFFIGYYSEENKLGNDLDMLIETINSISRNNSANNGWNLLKEQGFFDALYQEIKNESYKESENDNENFRLNDNLILNDELQYDFQLLQDEEFKDFLEDFLE
jgi:hypothetical protein